MSLIDTPLIEHLTHFLDATAYRSGIIAGNIANAESTNTAKGGPYQRKEVVFQR
jgi:flagellar basal body rod protein FlgC